MADTLGKKTESTRKAGYCWKAAMKEEIEIIKRRNDNRDWILWDNYSTGFELDSLKTEKRNKESIQEKASFFFKSEAMSKGK